MATLNTPVLFLIFNRPCTTKRVFEVVSKVQPSRLYVAADGPRSDHSDEAERCFAARGIATDVDWPCEVRTLFREENLGCKRAVSSAITWFFEHEEFGIILEDDCLPHPDFFNFCEAMLDYYRDDERVDVITGNNFQNGQQRGTGTYYFSKYNHCWGWASWRRAWHHYQGDLPFWPEWKHSGEWRALCPDKVERCYWEKIFDQVYAGGIDSWAYPWTACVWKHGGLTVTPNVNLVSNIGFGEYATHTASVNSPLDSMKTMSIGSIVYNDFVDQDKLADQYTFDFAFGGKAYRFPGLIFTMCRRLFGKLYRRVKSVVYDSKI